MAEARLAGETARADARTGLSTLAALPAILPAGLILAGFCAAMLQASGSATPLWKLAVLALGCMVISLAGEVVIGALVRTAWPGRLAVSLIVGTVLAAMVQLFGVFVIGLDAAAAFVLFAVLVLACSAAYFRRHAPERSGANAADLAVLGAIALIIAFACRDVAAALPTIVARGQMSGFVDDLLHAAHIADFGDPRGFGRGYLLLPDVPLFLYHYAYYMPSAAMARLFDLPPLTAASALLMPAGLVLGAAGAYGLGASLGGRLAGLLTLAALTALPDGGHYGLGNGFFGFHWVMFSTPGSGYGIAAAAAALVCFDRVAKGDGGWKLAALGVLLAAAIFQLRAHLILIFVPALLVWGFCGLPPIRRRPGAVVAAGVAIVVAFAAAFLLVPAFSTRIIAGSNVGVFLTIAHDYLGPTIRPDWFRDMASGYGMPAAILVGIAFIFPAVLGIFVVAYPALLLAKGMRLGWSHIDAFPPILVAGYAGLVLLAPSATFAEPYTELQHRPIVLVYTVVVAFSCAYLVRLLRAERVAGAPVLAGAGLVTAASVGLMAWTGYEAPRPAPQTVIDYYRRTVPPDLVPLALALRQRAAPGDTFAVAVADPAYKVVDLGTEIAAISGVPCYVARPREQATVSALYAETIATRLARLERIAASADLPTARTAMRQAGIEWYVVPAGEAPSFDPGLAGAIVTNAAGSLYGAGGG